MSTMSWSSPVRQRSKKMLPPIPNEIYLEIFKLFKPPTSDSWVDRKTIRHLACLALVCRFFYSIVVPWMFESVQISFRVEKDGKRTKDHEKFCRGVAGKGASARATAKLVKRCSITCSSLNFDKPEDPAATNREFLSLYSKAMWQMSNLNDLLLFSISLTKEFILSLVNLHNLKSLSIHNCSLADDVNERHLRGVSSLKLECLRATFTDTDEQGILEGITAEAVHPFFDQLAFGSLLDLWTSSWYLIQRLAEVDETLSLQKLSIFFVNDLDILTTLFQRTPLLKTLRVVGVIPLLINPKIKFQLDTKALPMLEDAEAPVPILSGLVPGRPISTLRILSLTEKHPTMMHDEDIKAFTCSSSFISHIQMPRRFYAEFPFHQHFPHLHTLRLNFSRQDLPDIKRATETVGEILSELANSWPKHPPLHTLRLDFEGISMANCFLNLEKQHHWLSDILMPKIPALRKFHLAEFMQWSYHEHEKDWKPRMSPVYISIVIALWQLFKGQVKYVDFDGCLGRLLHNINVDDDLEVDFD